jgi:hypothetical protein
MQPDAVAEEHANPRLRDDQRDRAVSFVVRCPSPGPTGPAAGAAHSASTRRDHPVPARFTTAGAGKYTINWFNMMGTPKGVDGAYIRINTGTTYGGGATITAGPLQRVAGPMPAGNR